MEQFSTLLESRTSKKYRKKDMIYSENQEANSVYFVKSGKIKIYRTNEEGRELIVALIGQGEFFGYLALLQERLYPEYAVAMAETELTLIPKKDFLALLHSNQEIATGFVKVLAGYLLNVEEQLVDLAYNSVRKRVADALLRLKKRYDIEGSDKFTMAILRDDLASMVGTAKETVIRMLSDFKDEKLIEIKGSKITILNEKALEEMFQ